MCPHSTLSPSFNAGLAFGAGPYRCPGRFFAEMEVALLLQLILHSYDLQLAAVDTSHLTSSTASPGTLLPKSTPDTRPRTASAAIHSSTQNVEAERVVRLSAVPPDACPVKAAAPCTSLFQQLFSIAGDQEWLAYGLGIFNVDGRSSRALGQSCGISARSASKTATAPQGSGNGSVMIDEQHTGLHDWKLSGDPAALLPACDLIRLVGIKHPASVCSVSVRRRNV